MSDSRPVRALVQTRRLQILEAACAAGAENVRVFGSVARGTGSEGSDLGLLVDGIGPLDVAGLTETLRELLGIPVDVATEEPLKPEALGNALLDARPL